MCRIRCVRDRPPLVPCVEGQKYDGQKKKVPKLVWGGRLIDKPSEFSHLFLSARCWGRTSQSEAAPPPNFFCFGEGHAFACGLQPFCSHSDNSRETPLFAFFLLATPVSQTPHRSNPATTTLSFPVSTLISRPFFLLLQCRTTATTMRAAHRK